MSHKHLKKKISIVTILFTVFLLLASSTVVQAAVNPLSKMPKKASGIANTAVTGIGAHYMTPEYTSKVKIKVKSYDPKIATVKGFSEQNIMTKKYYAWYEITCVSPGTTKIKVTVTVNKKSYSKICNYTVYKWENPLKTLKIGSKDQRSKFNKNSSFSAKQDISGKTFNFKLNPDFTFVSAIAQTNKDNVSLKPGKNTLPQNTYKVFIQTKSKKNSNIYTVCIYIPQNYPY